MSGPNANRVARFWGANPPDWVRELARMCDESSQVKVAKQIGVSAPVVTQVLNRSYKGRIDRVEQRVRGELMRETVLCPIFGEPMLKHDCLDNQRRGFGTENPLRRVFFRTCPSCPNREKT